MANRLIQTLRNIIKEELDEMARPSFSLKILDKNKAERIKKLHSGHWVSEMIDLIINAGENGTSRGEIADALDKNPRMLQNELKALQDNGIISKDTPTSDKPEKEPGQRGRKANDKSKEGIVRTLVKNYQDNPDFEPTEDDLTYVLPKGLGTEKLSPEQLAKVKNSALGLTKRGRPKTQAESLYETYLRLQNLKG